MWKNLRWREWFRIRTAQENQLTDYHNYILSGKEWLICIGQGGVIITVIAWFFYHSGYAVLPLSGFLILWKSRTAKKLAEERKEKLVLQFRDFILAVSSGLQAGYSIENAFLEAGRETIELHGEQSLIGQEIKLICHGIGNHVSLEMLLLDLGRRSDQDDIGDFAEIFSIARRSGGNLREIIRKSAEMTGEKIAVQREIRTILSSRRYEQKIMNMIPILIIAYLQMTSQGYFNALYGNLPGILIMTGALAVYLAAWHISDKMVEIEV